MLSGWKKGGEIKDSPREGTPVALRAPSVPSLGEMLGNVGKSMRIVVDEKKMVILIVVDREK